MTNRATFLKLIREDILKLDLAELDFGIYRVLNYRRAEIERFIDDRLSQLMSGALRNQAGDRLGEIERRLDALREKLNQTADMMGFDSAFVGDQLREQLKTSPVGEEYVARSDELRYLQAEAGFTQSEEDRLYNTLYLFFSRYYRDGDFMTQPRRSRDAKYTVPYSGDDVHFHWKSRGSHYVKTSEELRTYSYRAASRRVVFELRAANEEKDNNKGATRYFIPQANAASDNGQTQTFTVPFVFRPLSKVEEASYNGKKKEPGDRVEETDRADKTLSIQDRLLTAGLEQLRSKLPIEVSSDELLRHMRRYARKNRTDYFVHGDLKTFLTGEFEFYLKNEFLSTAALTGPEAISDAFIKLNALRQIGGEIIALLDQIEAFQARLFEKRKFVLRSDYLIPVRLLPRETWTDVLANKNQLAAWRTLFGIVDPIDERTLEMRPTLVVDTRHFDASFARRALSAFEDLDGITDGLLIHGENYAALQTIRPSFENRIKVIYIDPPYNTGNDGFLYKDDFSRHSTWLSMMEERLRLGKDLLDEDGVIFVSIDDNEQANLKALMDDVFGGEHFVATVIWQKVYSPKNTARYFSEDHDFILVYAKNVHKWRPSALPRSEEANARYRNLDNDPRGEWKPSDLLARNYYSKGTYDISSPGGKTFRNPIGTYWRVSKEKFNQLDADNRIWWGPENNNMPALKRFLSEVKEGVVPQTLWLYKDVGHTQDAKKELISIVHFNRSEEVLNTIKPVNLIRRVLQIGTDVDEASWICDFFAGSGTTAHAVIAQNAADGGQRKFIITEMGDYFEQLTFQRVIRAMYSPMWKDGKPERDPVLPPMSGTDDGGTPLEWVERSPRLVKLLRLESYDDSLNALELPQERDARMAGQLQLFNNEYLLQYMLDTESVESPVLLNTQMLEAPFDYKLRLLTPDGELNVPVDLVETFNLVMGLHVQRIRELRDPDSERPYVVVEALQNGREVLVVWRNVADVDPAKERAFLLSKYPDITNGRYATIYTNADSALPNGQSVDMLFKNRMLKPETERGGLE